MNEKDMPIGVGVLVVKDGRILCGIRTDNGQVCGPGGHIEQGEDPAHAAQRELQEEFGIKPLSLIPVGCLDGSGGAYRPTKVFLCKDFEGEVNTDDSEMALPYFASIKELQNHNLDIHPAFEDSIKLLLKTLEGEKDNESSGNTEGD